MLSRLTVRSVSLAGLIFCASVASAEDDPYANIHSVAVISAMGDTVAMNSFALTVFGDEQYQVHTDWKVDAKIEGEVASALSGRFVVQHVSVDRAAISVVAAGAPRAPKGIRLYDHTIAQLIQSQPKPSGIDAYVVVVPAAAQSGGMMSARSQEGLFGTRQPESFDGPYFTFGVFYFIGVYDATGKRIGSGDNIYSPILHVEQCAKEMWADKEAALTPEQTNRIRQEIFALITRNIPFSLADAHLIGFDAAKSLTQQRALAGDPSCREPEF